jgi:exopolyphosphatase/guanosine-5'-triphosphate,3'-diphosphate pyrophosphatase
MAPLDVRGRARVPGIDQKRAETIHLGGLLLEAILQRLKADRVVLCARALREGLILDHLERLQCRLGPAIDEPDLRMRSVLELASRLDPQPTQRAHAEKVRRFALRIFDATTSLHRLPPAARRTLELAAILHDIGQHIRYERHERHAHYLIRNADLPGFARDEVEVLALVCRYHRGPRPKKRHPEYGALRKRDRDLVRRLAAILRIADGLDRSHFQVVEDIDCAVEEGRLVIRVAAREDAELELWAARRKRALFERVFGVPVRIELAVRPERIEAPAAGVAAEDLAMEDAPMREGGG